MLNIYQEFVRNHQYSLQILAHCKQNRDFDKLLKHYEAKPDCEERTLETFLTYPMFQVAPCPVLGAAGRGARPPVPLSTPGPELARPASGSSRLWSQTAQLQGSSQLTSVLCLPLSLPVLCCCSVPPPVSTPPAPSPPQIPRYILTLHELLAHTPHEHVERNSLDYAKSKLEELSR